LPESIESNSNEDKHQSGNVKETVGGHGLGQLEEDDAEVVDFVLLFEVVAIDEESWQLFINFP